MIPDDPLTSYIEILEYSPLWLETGLLSEEHLRLQIAHFRTGQDNNTEHYRYSAFRLILASRSAITDMEIEQYMALAKIDSDVSMGRAALHDLLNWPNLTTEQFDRLTNHPTFSDPSFQRLAFRRRLLTRIKSDDIVSDATFVDCLESRMDTVQRRLIDRCKLTQLQLAILVEQGITRAVRNIAKEQMNRNTARERSRRKKNSQ